MKGSLLSSQIAEPYAQALMSLAQEHDLIARFEADVRGLLGLLIESDDLKDCLANPVFQDTKKKAILKQIAGETLHPYLANFLMLLVDKRRIVFLVDICQQFLSLVRELNNVVLAEVTSAQELTPEQEEAVTAKVKALTNAASVELQTQTDDDLIGGVVIKVGSQVFDASLRGQLRRIGFSLGSTA